MSAAAENEEEPRTIPTSKLIPLPASWIDDFVEVCEEVKTVRLLFARGSRAELTPPPELDDFHIRLQDMPRNDGQGVLKCFDVDGLGLYQGPRQFCDFLWSEGQEYYRAVCLQAGRDDQPAPRRLRIVARLLDGTGAELTDLGGYTGLNPKRGATKRAAARGIEFAEDNVDEPMPSHGMGRINASLEKGYLTMMKRLDASMDKRMEDVTKFAEATYRRADEYHSKVADKEGEGDMDDEIVMAGLALANTIFGEKNKRNEKADEVKSQAPKDGKAGGPACAYAREALTHFDKETVQRCRDNIGAELTDEMMRILHYAEEPNADDKKLLKDFRKTAEQFIALYQKDAESIRRCIPMGAAKSLDALLKLSLA